MDITRNTRIVRCTIESSEVQKILDDSAHIIEQFVDYGSRIFELMHSEMQNRKVPVPVLYSFRHFLELMDSISLLLRNGFVDPCKLSLRVLFEITVNIHWLLHGNKLEKSIRFQRFYQNQKRTTYEKVFLGKTQKAHNNKEMRNWYAYDELEGKKLYHLCVRLDTKEEFSKKSYSFETMYTLLYDTWSKDIHGIAVLDKMELEKAIAHEVNGELIREVPFPATKDCKDFKEVLSASVFMFDRVIYKIINSCLPERLGFFQSWLRENRQIIEAKREEITSIPIE